MKTKKLVCYNCGGHGFITVTYENGQTSTICPVCGGIGTHEIQMTNADRIRAMSDEELATFINRVVICHHLRNERNCEKCPIHPAKPCDTEGIVKWLQQPAEEDDHDERKENENVRR